jgi:hypothetical protein
MDETDLLSLIRPWLDTNYQITTKRATWSFYKKFYNWTSRWALGTQDPHDGHHVLDDSYYSETGTLCTSISTPFNHDNMWVENHESSPLDARHSGRRARRCSGSSYTSSRTSSCDMFACARHDRCWSTPQQQQQCLHGIHTYRDETLRRQCASTAHVVRGRAAATAWEPATLGRDAAAARLWDVSTNHSMRAPSYI